MMRLFLLAFVLTGGSDGLGARALMARLFPSVFGPVPF